MAEPAALILTYRYRVRGVAAARELERMARAVNYVWNFCGGAQQHAERWSRFWPDAYDREKLAAGSSRDLGLLSDTIGSVCQRYAVNRQVRRRRPRMRGRRSLGWVPFKGRNVRLECDRLRFAKRDYRLRLSRAVPGRIRSGSFSQDSGGRWFVNLSVEVERQEGQGAGEVGLDLGLKALATLSTGETISNPRLYRRYAQELATAQRAGRKNRVRAIHRKIVEARRHHLHNHSAALVRRFGRIVVGGVEPAHLAKTRLAKSVFDAGWSTLRSQLRYKAMAHGVEYVEVDERYTTRTCSACSSRSGPKGIAGLGVRSWVCEGCGAAHERDVNAAINILALGRSAGLQMTGTAAYADVSVDRLPPSVTPAPSLIPSALLS